jgi:hypothetical protein
MKIHPVGAELFHAAGRKDRHDEAIGSFFAIFANALKTLPTIIVINFIISL